MYWYSTNQASPEESGFDICWARLHVLGYDVYCSQETSSLSDFSDLMEPLQLARGDELYSQEFVNILHALQVPKFLPDIFCCSDIII